MPVLESTFRRPPPLLRNPHVQTVWAAALRRVRSERPRVEVLDTPDGDFAEAHWRTHGHPRLLVVCHGLGGDASAVYVRGLARAAAAAGWDTACLTFRGAGPRPNRLLRAYHSGDTADLDLLVGRAVASGRWTRIALAGFSLGGNVVLRYLGVGAGHAAAVRGAVAFSAPCDLASCAQVLAHPSNRAYMRRFLRRLNRNVAAKQVLFPGRLPPMERFARMRTFREFDDAYTAPTNGFRDAAHYWESCSSLGVLGRIDTPTLLLTSTDDPFLAPACFPFSEARHSRSFHLEATSHGGHMGWAAPRIGPDPWWHERRALDFLGRAG